MANSSTGKILVVDDEVELKNVLVDALTSQGFETVGFTSGEEALAALRGEAFDVLLADLMMPGMDGITLVREGLEIDPHLVAIMMTGQGTIQTAVDAMKEGAFDYVLKPFRLQTVLPVFTRAMKARQMRLENLQLRETLAIYELGQTIAFTLDPQTVICKLADAASLQTNADEVSVLLLTSDHSELYVAEVRGENREGLLGERVPLKDGISSWVMHERTPLILDGEISDERFRALWPRPEIRSAISVPMLVANKLVGTININALNSARPFNPGQMKALTLLASIAAAALETASLYDHVSRAENDFRSIFENSIEGIFQATRVGRYVKVNPAMARILGYDSPTDLIDSVNNIWHQVYVHPEKCVEILSAIEAKGSIQDFELEAYRKNGDKIWLSMNIREVRDEGGGEPHYEGTIEDITELKKAEAERLVMFEIIQGVSMSADLGALLELIHGAIQKVVYAENCFVSLYDEHTDTLGMQFFVDKCDSVPAPQKLGKSCAAYVFRTGEPLLMNQARFDQLVDAGEVELVGVPSPSWLGVPLNTPAKTIGVLVVQHYEDDCAYSERNVEFLSSVGSQIAVAIERKLVEDQLKKNEARYRDLVENAHDLIYEHDLDGNYVSANQAVEQMTGYSLEECLDLKVEHIVAPEFLETSREMIRRKLAGEKVTAYALEIVAKDGHRVALEVNSNLVLRGGVPVGIRGIARDITERKRTEADLVRLAAAVAQTADSVVVTDTKGNIQYVNPAFERISGYAKEEVINQNSRILKSGKTDPAVYTELWETITRGSVWVGNLTNRKKDGTLFDERVTISAVYDEAHEIVSYIAVKQDVSERLKLEEQLRQSQKMEAIGQLAGGVAHDFNNLLTVIGGYSELLLRRLPEESPFRTSIEEIKKAGERAGGLTRQLLAFSRKQILQPKILDINVVVSDLDKMLRRLIGEDISLMTFTEPGLGQVKADPGQIEQVLLNLAVNARDAMPDGGQLTIQTSNVCLSEDFAHHHLSAEAGNFIMLSVSDNGGGMDMDTKDRIFEPFFTTKGPGKGTGLGLSTVYGIVKQSGGHIWVYSEVGKGTAFKIYLPRVDEPGDVSFAHGDSTLVPHGTETILLVEDEEQVRRISREILEMLGYQVLVAVNGEEALAIAQQHDGEIDLMITDVVMPKMGGRELVERLSPSRPIMKLLYMSGYTDDAIVRHGLIDEQLQFIGKPFTTDALARKVRNVLDSGSGINAEG